MQKLKIEADQVSKVFCEASTRLARDVADNLMEQVSESLGPQALVRTDVSACESPGMYGEFETEYSRLCTFLKCEILAHPEKQGIPFDLYVILRVNLFEERHCGTLRDIIMEFMQGLSEPGEGTAGKDYSKAMKAFEILLKLIDVFETIEDREVFGFMLGAAEDSFLNIASNLDRQL